MTTLWNPRKPLSQPPHYGHVGHPEQPKSTPADLAVSGAKTALFEAHEHRTRKNIYTSFDKGLRGTR